LHSKRFSSAGGGEYRLYHERIRVYVLQKVSEKDIMLFNNKFISLCETALETISEKDIPEKESYAHEFISTHFFISAMQGEKECLNKEQAAALKKYAYDQQFWERQYKVSKGFEWSKRMLNQMMSWASKFKEDDEVIECSLNKVDLYHQEQNDAPRIVQLVADGDIETVLARIEKFGGEDKEGLQRKFTLYMLCLMELTLLDSKEKDHAKSSIEKILKHLDDNIPANQPELIDWSLFFSSHLLFSLLVEWEKFNISGMMILFRTTDWNSPWITEKEIFSESELMVLERCLLLMQRKYRIQDYSIRDNNFSTLNKYTELNILDKNSRDIILCNSEIKSKYSVYNNSKSNSGGDANSSKLTLINLKRIDDVKYLMENKNYKEALNKIEDFIFLSDKCKGLIVICQELIKKKQRTKTENKLIEEILNKLINNTNDIEKVYIKVGILCEISKLYELLGKLNNRNSIFEQAFQDSLKIEILWEKQKGFITIMNFMSVNGLYSSIVDYSMMFLKKNRGLENEQSKTDAKNQVLVDLISCYASEKKQTICDYLINLINNKNYKETAIALCAFEYTAIGNLELAVNYTLRIKRIDVRKDFISQFIKKLKKSSNENLISSLLEKLKDHIAFSELEYYQKEHSFDFGDQIEDSKGINTKSVPFLKIREFNSFELLKSIYTYSIKTLQNDLQYYALNQLFFSNLPKEKLDRYNRTLNLQWAIDIKNQMPN
jgi:hypothetical protein